MHTSCMGRRTTLEVDEELLAAAKEVLGTRGLKDTVDAALSETVRAARRRRLGERLRTGEGLDLELLGPEGRARMWR